MVVVLSLCNAFVRHHTHIYFSIADVAAAVVAAVVVPPCTCDCGVAAAVWYDDDDEVFIFVAPHTHTRTHTHGTLIGSGSAQRRRNFRMSSFWILYLGGGSIRGKGGEKTRLPIVQLFLGSRQWMHNEMQSRHDGWLVFLVCPKCVGGRFSISR